MPSSPLLPPNAPLLLLSGPPFSPAIFRDGVARLGAGEAVALLDPGRPGGWEERGRALSGRILQGRSVVFAHGLAIPAAVAAAAARPPALLVLSDGPLTHLDPITRALSTLSRTPLARPLLWPRVWLGYLASSAGLRRAVVNPYVMDPDIVATLAGPLVADRKARRALQAYLASLSEGLPPLEGLSCPVSLLWGSADPLYPLEEAQKVLSRLKSGAMDVVSGGRWAHVEERPWAWAEALAARIWMSGVWDGGAAEMSEVRGSGGVVRQE